jgi:transposase
VNIIASSSWLDEIREACLTASKQVLPQSTFGRAAAYTLNMWAKLERCFEYEQVELSNNLAENSMRPVALGRKNWLHVGSVKSGPKVAAILSIVESCRRLVVPVQQYLSDVLPGLDRRTLSQVAEITPAPGLRRTGESHPGFVVRLRSASQFRVS